MGKSYCEPMFTVRQSRAFSPPALAFGVVAESPLEHVSSHALPSPNSGSLGFGMI